MDWRFILIEFILFYLLIILFLHIRYPEWHHKWGDIDHKDFDFPSDFNWGVSTSSYQIEGGIENNWSLFESAQNMERCNDACNHWNLWEDDFKLLSELGVGSYRLSVEWSRIQPEIDQWNEKALKVYSDMVDCLLKLKIRPMVTLHHFTHPIWFENLGGFANRDNLKHWKVYSQKVVEELGDRVKYWCTINEPAVFSIMGYTIGIFPPGRKSILTTMSVMRNLMEAHTIAYHSMKSLHQDIKVGFAKNITLYDPYHRWNIIHWIMSYFFNKMWNHCWIHALKKGKMLGRKIPGAKNSIDFFGLNYYTHILTSPFMPRDAGVELLKRKNEYMTEFGYAMYAEGLLRAIEMISSLNVPIEITENGVADKHDKIRKTHILRHLSIINDAISKDIDIRSYHHWSLLDNFEWAEGYKLNFGLYNVDFSTQERILRESGNFYKEFIFSQKQAKK